jgi:hypothetical protein
MAMTRAKTWVSKLSYHQDASYAILTLNKWIWWDLKEALQYGSNGVKGGTNAWTVRGSSDASTAGLDGSDRWTDYSKLTFHSTTACSWIVLQNTAQGVAPGYMQLLISCKITTTSGASITIVVSPAAGFTGGNTTTNPSATDQVVLVNAAAVLDTTIPTSGSGGVLRVMSSDGVSTRAFICSGGVIKFMLWLETARNPEAYWTNPYIAMAKNPLIANVVQAAGVNTHLGGVASTLSLSGETAAGGLITETLLNRPDGDGAWNFLPTGFISSNTSSRGKPGEPWDMYIAPSVLASGMYARGTGAAWDWIVMGNLLIGWDGSIPAIP